MKSNVIYKTNFELDLLVTLYLFLKYNQSKAFFYVKLVMY